MSRLHRLLPVFALSGSLAYPLLGRAADTPAAGGDKAAAAAPAAAAAAPAAPAIQLPANQTVKEDVDDFFHYGIVARYDLSAALGKRILERVSGGSAKPEEVLADLKSEVAERNDSLEKWLLRWSSLEGDKASPAGQMKDVTVQLMKVLDQGRYAQRHDKAQIQQDIERLGEGERAFMNAVGRLRNTGELAVPYMIDYLKDPSKAPLHDPIRRALVELGRPVVNPLLAATEATDVNTLGVVISVLRDIGYDTALPYLARLSASKDAVPQVRSAAADALQRMGASSNADVAKLFYSLGEKFYYGTSALSPAPGTPVSIIWFWQDGGLVGREVPASIYGDVMTMRESRFALEISGDYGDALSLWLAANNKLEVDLPEGTANPLAEKDRPAANYYNARAGAKYLNAIVVRCMDDHNSAVLLKVIKSLSEIVGPSSMFTGAKSEPVVGAMAYPDKLVRFEAAFALASAAPQKPFAGQESVVPLLAEALSQTGVANVLVIAPSQDDRTKLITDLKGYGTGGGTNAEAALADAASLPSIDVVLLSEDLGAQEVSRAFGMLQQSPRTARAAKLVIVKSEASPYARQALADPLLSVTTANDAASLTKAVEDAERSGNLPLDEKTAASYALKAAGLLEQLAVARSPVFDLAAAESTLLASLKDKRPEVAKAAGAVLARMNSKSAESALLTQASADATPDDVKISFFKSIATSAKLYGNRLEGGEVETLQKTAGSATNLELRTSAAEAAGALNLPTEQSKELILQTKW